MGRRAFRRCVGALLIILSLVVASFPTNEARAEETKSVATDFQLNGTTLVKYTGTATTVSVPDSVKVIGEEAFADNTYMTSIKLPANLEKISYAAFSGCNNLKTVTVPNNVTEIGTAAFANCTALASAAIGSSTKTFGIGVFTGCQELSSVTGNDRIICENGVIYDKDKTQIYEVLQNAKVKKDASSNDLVNMTGYTMPDSVVKISPYAFYGCKNIEKVTLSNALEEIPEYSFSYCNGLTELTLPYSVKRIDVKAFQYCVNLEKVEIPISVTFIHDTAFDGCSKLKIVAPEGSYAANWFKKFDNSNVNIIDSEDNNNSSSGGNKDASGNVIDDPAYVAPEIEGLLSETRIVGRQAVFFIDNTKQKVVSGPGAKDITGNSDNTEDYAEMVEQMETALQTETHGKGLSLPKFAIIGDKVAGKAFYEDKTLTEYTIPSNITSIGDFAFARSNLEAVTIPNGVTHIGYGAFYHCDSLATILVPGTVTDIEPSAFERTRMMSNWKMYGESDFLIMGDGILVAYKGSGNYVEIPEGVKQIGPQVFKDNKYITEVSIPDTAWRVCEEAFSGCSALKAVGGGMSVEVIEDRAFAGCPIDTVRIVDTVRKMGIKAFDPGAAGNDSAHRTAVFSSGTLPLVSYNKTTSRLTNSSYRGDALENVNVAIVKNEDVNRLNTVLDRSESGFSGLVCVISDEPTEYFNGELKIIDCTLTAKEAENIDIPSTVYIYGKGYNFRSDQLESVMTMARSGAYYEDVEEAPTVSFTGSGERYVLDVIKDSYVNISVKDAYKRIYGDTVPANFTTYTIYMTDVESGVRITKFGKQTYPITIELPDNMPTSNLHVICIDEYDQLEDLPFKVQERDGKLSVQFDISHTGYYGLYSFNSTAVSKYNLDVSPDTGDRIHPKWFLAVGLLALGLVMILIKGKEKAIVQA